MKYLCHVWKVACLLFLEPWGTFMLKMSYVGKKFYKNRTKLPAEAFGGAGFPKTLAI